MCSRERGGQNALLGETDGPGEGRPQPGRQTAASFLAGTASRNGGDRWGHAGSAGSAGRWVYCRESVIRCTAVRHSVYCRESFGVLQTVSHSVYCRESLGVLQPLAVLQTATRCTTGSHSLYYRQPLAVLQTATRCTADSHSVHFMSPNVLQFY